jgi:hypothetical protein
LAISFSFKKAGNEGLKTTGIEVSGIVFLQQTGPGNFTSLNDQDAVNNVVFIRFVTLEKEWITGPIKQNFKVFYPGQYKDGERVKVFYDKTNPHNFYVTTKQSDLFVKLSIVIVGLIFIVVGMYKYLAE